MKTHRIVVWMMPLGCVAWLSACNMEQPLPQCAVGRGDHAVRYTLKTGTGTCAQKTAEVVGAQIFRVPGSGIPPTLVLKPAPLAALEGQDPAHSVMASGDFTTEYPSQSGECVVPQMSEARQAVNTVDLRYEWSNLRIQGLAAIPGTQWTGELKYSEGNCTATYEAVGVFPAIKCEKKAADGTTVRDPSVCKLPRPGLSLNPAYPVTCDEATNLCVLEGMPPALVP
jgi:hypothetical protein